MDIYVGNLPYAVTDEEVRELFEPFGKVDTVRVIFDRNTGRSKGFGFVTMADQAEGENAIENTNGADFLGRSLRVNESRPKPMGGGGGGGGYGGGGGGGGYGGGGGGGGYGGGGGGGGDRRY